MARLLTRTAVFLSVCILCLIATLAVAQDIDWNKAKQLRQRMLQGEKLSQEEMAYLERARQALQAKQKSRPFEQIKPPVGLKPLTDMTAEDRYKGQDGGLYGGGKSVPPEKHLRAALQQAKLIRPLDAEGKPSEGRKIDDLVWKPEDLAGDGTHPSDSGRRKVAELLLRFMKSDPTAKTWFIGQD